MDKNTEDIIESLAFIKDNMATKDDLNDLEGRLGDRISKIDDRLTAVESKIEGTNRRLDIEAMSRTDARIPDRVAAIERHLGINKEIVA